MGKITFSGSLEQLGTLRVLLIEDSASDAQLIAELLASTQSMGLTTCEHLAEGLERLVQHGADLLLLDLALPDSSGLDTLLKVRQAAPALPIIVLTSLADPQIALQVLRAGAQDCLHKKELTAPLLERAIGYSLERSRIRQALQTSEQRLNSFFLGTTAGLALFDRELRFIRVNQTLAGMGGPPAPAYLGRTMRGVVPRLAPIVEPIIQQVFSSGKAVSDFEVSGEAPGTPGVQRHWVASLFPVGGANGKAEAVGAIVVEVTVRKLIEEELRRSQADLAEAQQVAHLGNWSFEVATGSVRWSEEARRIFGLEASGLGCGYEAFLNCLQPEDRSKLERLGAEAAATGRPFEIEFRIQTPAGQTKWVRQIGKVAQDATGRSLRLFGTAQDITECKQVEEVLRRSEQQLRALTAHVDRLREEERTRISREIHDELGQMLTGIKMDLRWMEHRLEEFGDDRRLNPVLDKLVAAAELTDAIVRVVQRIAAELRPGILDKLGLPMALHYEASRFQERTGILCRLIAPEEPPPLPPEVATALFRIFQEALTNVARHAQATAVEVAFQPGAAGWRLEIRDNGKGLAGVDLVRPSSLGLLGMQERARLLGGEVTFTTRPGGGTIITVGIPVPGAGRGEV